MALPVHPNDRGRVVRDPPNDSGPLRGVVDQHGNIVGVWLILRQILVLFEPARLEPLDRQGRLDIQTYNNQVVSVREVQHGYYDGDMGVACKNMKGVLVAY